MVAAVLCVAQSLGQTAISPKQAEAAFLNLAKKLDISVVDPIQVRYFRTRGSRPKYSIAAGKVSARVEESGHVTSISCGGQSRMRQPQVVNKGNAFVLGMNFVKKVGLQGDFRLGNISLYPPENWKPNQPGHAYIRLDRWFYGYPYLGSGGVGLILDRRTGTLGSISISQHLAVSPPPAKPISKARALQAILLAKPELKSWTVSGAVLGYRDGRGVRETKLRPLAEQGRAAFVWEIGFRKPKWSYGFWVHAETGQIVKSYGGKLAGE